MAEGNLLTESFTEYTAPQANDVHVIAQDWQGQTHDFELKLTPLDAKHYRTHAEVDQLDVNKLEAAGILEGAHHGAFYTDLDSLATAVSTDYKTSMKEAVEVYNKIAEHTDPGNTFSVNTPAVDVFDINEKSWESMVTFLEGARASADNMASMMQEQYPGGDTQVIELRQLSKQAEEAMSDLQNAGAMANQIAEINFTTLKPPGPGIESEARFDFSEFDLDTGISGAPAPAIGGPKQ